MLIRSQNKLELTPMNQHFRIRISEDMNLYQIGYWGLWQYADYFNILGNYSTKEKALIVLDMIQEYYYQYINTQNTIVPTFATFQMPQDDEV